MTQLKSKLLCLVFPIGTSETSLLSSRGSIEIIAAEQYLLMRSQITEYDVMLYNDSIERESSDILLIMTCLTLVPVALIEKFERVIYFFDDLTVDKWRHETAYSERVSHLSAIFHPLRLEAAKLGTQVGKPSFHVPWSLSRLPSNAPQKSSRPSFFVDMDHRASYADSIPAANAFISVARAIEGDIYVPEKCLSLISTDLSAFVQPVPLMPHKEFLEFIGTVWFYASGIKGSYEFVVLESAFLGCGLISLFSAVKAEHQARSFYLAFDGADDFAAKLHGQVLEYNPSKILMEAPVIYPADGTKRIPQLLQELFVAHA